MRAAVLKEFGGIPEVEDFAEPEAGDGEVLVNVTAAALNPIDVRVASGALAARRPPLPSVVGMEGTGRTAGGRRVYFGACVAPWGSLAERAAVPERECVELPGGLEDTLAVAYGVAGLAAWLALERRARVSAGDTVIVLGASGTVGMIAVQAARLLGAGRVVAAARSEDALALAAERGADATVRLDREGAELTQAFLEAAGGEANVVFDPLWGAPAAAALGALAPGGRLVQLGESAGATATLPSATIRFKEIAVLGHTNFATPPGERAAALQRMWSYAAQGQLQVDVETVPLADAAKAWQRQVAGPGCKLVVVP